MATEKRLIDANVLQKKFEGLKEKDSHATGRNAYDLCAMLTEDAPTVDAVEVPCKIGDFVWAIRRFKGKKHPQRGVVSEMSFNKRMELIIVVKYVARGEWGKTVFATDKEAYVAIGERKVNGTA